MGSFVLGITDGLLSNGRWMRHGLYLIKVIRFQAIEIPDKHWQHRSKPHRVNMVLPGLSSELGNSGKGCGCFKYILAKRDCVSFNYKSVE